MLKPRFHSDLLLKAGRAEFAKPQKPKRLAGLGAVPPKGDNGTAAGTYTQRPKTRPLLGHLCLANALHTQPACKPLQLPARSLKGLRATLFA